MISNKKQDSRISGTYICTLVKQLASSKSKGSLTMSPPDNPGENPVKPGQCTGKSSKVQMQTHKKQARRRLHTSRPYQERLLNMAEARREIVTALKQHRATMKQASEQRQRQQTQPQPQTVLLREQESRPSLISSDNVMNSFSLCVHPPPPPKPPGQFLWPISTNPPLNFVLPNQPLGLNLNFHDFDNIIQTSPSSSSSICTNPPIYSSASSSSSPPEAVTTPAPLTCSTTAGETGYHQTVDEEEMMRMRMIGEKHQIEWNDTVNLVTSAWWFEFLKTVEPLPEQPPDIKSEIDYDNFRPFDDIMEFPSWLNPTEDFDVFQPYLTDYSSPDDPALSCMEIGEIEGMDGDWLA